MPPPLPLAGVDLTADAGTYMTPFTAVKGADQSVTSSTVLVNDTALLLPLAASQTYEIVLEGFWTPVNNSATPGISIAFTAPAAATFTYRALVPGNALILSLAGSAGISANASGTFSLLECYGICTMGATAGNLQFQFAQNILSATSTTMKATSFMTARRIA